MKFNVGKQTVAVDDGWMARTDRATFVETLSRVLRGDRKAVANRLLEVYDAAHPLPADARKKADNK